MRSLQLALVALCFAAPVAGHAATVIADGKEWRQVTETAGVSWKCIGNLNPLLLHAQPKRRAEKRPIGAVLGENPLALDDHATPDST